VKQHWLLLLALGACSDPPPTAPDYCVESEVTVTQGLYGRVTYTTDVGENPQPQPVPNMAVQVFDGPNGSAVANAITDEAGVYQVSLDVGSYALCYATNNCASFSIAANDLVRADLPSCFCENAWLVVERSSCAQ
jgi:hypothetical protein